MLISDLREYIKYLGSKRKLARISGSVSTDLEVTAITDLENKAGRYDGRALLFEDVEGYDIPVATNLFGSTIVLQELFGSRKITELFGLATGNSRQILPALKGAKSLIDSKPKSVGFEKSRYEKLKSIEELPVLKVWPNDAGRFITQPMVVTRSPIDGRINVGVYRMQVYDGETTGMHWQAQKGGAYHALEAEERKEELKVAVAIGSDPYTTIGAVAPIPKGISEYAFAGIARGSRSLLFENGAYPPVPANSEFIINGRVDPIEKRLEGPFGDHTGYYSIAEETYVFHVEEIYAKKKPIYPASVVGFPWHEDAVIGKFLMDYFNPIIRMMNDSILDIYLPPEGSFTNTCFIKVRKRFPGEAKKAMFAALGLGQLSFTKIIAAFDEDIDIRDFGSVIWALSTRVDPDRDMQIIKGAAGDSLDHSTGMPAYGSKVLIDATRKMPGEGYHRKWPETISMDSEVVKRVEKLWKAAR